MSLLKTAAGAFMAATIADVLVSAHAVSSFGWAAESNPVITQLAGYLPTSAVWASVIAWGGLVAGVSLLVASNVDRRPVTLGFTAGLGVLALARWVVVAHNIMVA